VSGVPWAPGLAAMAAEVTEVGLLAAELADARRSIAKLEALVERQDAQLSELERLAGRPVEVIIESYKRAQGRYSVRA
jgi:hypothetical protein